jgi:hypothetical protein
VIFLIVSLTMIHVEQVAKVMDFNSHGLTRIPR